MTQPGYTHIAMVLDRSGSMSTIKEDADGGIAEFIKDQQEQPGKCTVSVYTFDTDFEVEKDFHDIKDFGTFEIKPRGGTALHDAFGKTITLTGEKLNTMSEDERPEHVVVVVVTDGQENSSQEWKREQVFESVTHQQDTYGWTFVFLAANQDAISEGASYGLRAGTSMGYTGQSVGSSYVTASSSVSSLRGGGGFKSMPEQAPEATSTPH